jgi:hypothetical protein
MNILHSVNTLRKRKVFTFTNSNQLNHSLFIIDTETKEFKTFEEAVEYLGVCFIKAAALIADDPFAEPCIFIEPITDVSVAHYRVGYTEFSYEGKPDDDDLKNKSFIVIEHGK